ncbi:MAG: serine/threonine protein kinase [Microthrixaceae bacterium]|nr:serine/threonine protein kinase [Microthrixaceae bacterium]
MTQPEHPPHRFEDLTELTEIGHGGTATVYRCTQPDGSMVAMKLFHAATADDPAAVHFRREAEARRRVPPHPALLAAQATGRAPDGRPYLLLELADQTLEQHVAESGPMPWPDACALAVGVAGALETAHRAGLVHCDVSPANVHLVGVTWKLGDFGAACDRSVADADRPVTLVHAPPEALRGAAAAPSRDVYGLAATLYHAIAGAPAFGDATGQTAARIAGRIATEPVPDLRRTGTPDAVCRVVERAMSKDPARRPASVGQLADELAEAARSADVSVAPPLVLAPAAPHLTAAPPSVVGLP